MPTHSTRGIPQRPSCKSSKPNVKSILLPRPPLQLADRQAQVIFVRRHISRLDVERCPTELGSALITSAEQTVLDLAHRPSLGGSPAEARQWVAALWPRTHPELLAELAGKQRLGAALERAHRWAM